MLDQAIQVEGLLAEFDVKRYQTVITGASGDFGAIANIISGNDPNSLRALIASEVPDSENVSVSAAASGFGGAGVAISITGRSPDAIAQLPEFTGQIADAVASVENVTNVSSNIAAVQPTLQVQVDPAAAAEVGLSSAQISASLSNLSTSQVVTTAMLENGQFPVRLLVSGIMGLLFRSWLDPFVILFTLPLAAIGAIIALLATGTALSISVMIGVLMLVGIVVTNAIVMLEFVAGSQYLRRVGAWRSNTAAANSDDSASHHAGPCDDVFGLVNGALIAADLGRTVVGGLFTSTLLTLVVVPVVYSLVDDLKRRFGHSDDLVVVPESRAPVNQQLAGPETHSSAWLSHRRLPTR